MAIPVRLCATKSYYRHNVQADNFTARHIVHASPQAAGKHALKHAVSIHDIKRAQGPMMGQTGPALHRWM
ncbi:hypothetical protein [Komagataeibacter xylinus]|uniref:Uncharacterized protein n=1 Tax=Komagataeibacter xylinus TaxID=28448 RepID=A0A857FQD1_KOMXY|nr:hypothetical protein [Komagataeibacter xylinus]QHC36483.1 hypothetical protein FMA36_14115 [Komagataeibacter xylinus]